MKKLSISNCPSFLCKSTDIIKIKKRSYHYENDIYKCNDCRTEWSKDTMYCTKCLDVAMYCKCHEDID